MMQSTEIKTINELSRRTISNDATRTITPSPITIPSSSQEKEKIKGTESKMKIKWGGSIIARILPSHMSDYQCKKPTQNILPVLHRSGSSKDSNIASKIKNLPPKEIMKTASSIEKNIFNLNKDYDLLHDTNNASSANIVLLDINLHPIQKEQNNHLDTTIICHLKRNTNETIDSTFRRLEINIFRKILNYYESLNKQLLKEQKNTEKESTI